jgi:hypothetical protein
MSLDLPALVKSTSLKNKECVLETLKAAGVISYVRLQNLPGRYGRPFFCENTVYAVVSEINKAIDLVKEQIPAVDEILAKPEPESAPVTQETLLADLELKGVPPSKIKAMKEAGVFNVGHVLKDEGAALKEIPSFGEATKDRVYEAVIGQLST